MSRGMPGRVDPAPAGHVRHAPVVRQGSDAGAEIARAIGVGDRHERHHPLADRRIRRRIIGLAGQMGQLQPVGVDRHVPVLEQFWKGADMIEVAVRQDDRLRPAVLAEAVRGDLQDRAGRASQAAIDQHPRSGRAAQVDVDKQKAQPGQIRSRLVHRDRNCHAVHPNKKGAGAHTRRRIRSPERQR